MLFLKKSFSVFLYVVLLSMFTYANSCPKWFPMPSGDGMVVVLPIYDESITGPDLDCDEILDAVDTDIDGDGVTNSSDPFPLNGSEWVDTDGDGIGNNADADDDGDGYSDTIEHNAGSDPLDSDSTPVTVSHFVITIQTDNDGLSGDTEFTIPTTGVGYNYNVDCNNDGTDEATAIIGDYTCSYASVGTYTIVIKDNTGTRVGFPRIYFNNDGDSEKIVGINQWGTGKWTSMERAFFGCRNLNGVGGEATDRPDLSGVTDMSTMFQLTGFNQNIGNWDTSTVKDMSHVFMDTRYFNQNIGDWDTSQVTDMSYMFKAASFNNHDLSTWDVDNVVNHDSFMRDAGTGNTEPAWPHFVITVKTDNPGASLDTEFTIPTYSGENYNYNVDCNNDGINEATGITGDYTCSYVSAGTYTIAIKDNTDTRDGFPRIYFNNVGDKEKIVGINQWGTSKWTSMRYAFHGCSNLNNEGGAATDTPNLSGVGSMYHMFSGASVFNQDIGGWDTSNVTDMGSAFYRASSFNQDIGDWNTSSVKYMFHMFNNASEFSNQDLSRWDVVNVIQHNDFMYNTGTGNTEPAWPHFIITVKTDNTGASADTEFTIPTIGGGYDYNVDCDHDGTDEATGVTGNYTCSYASADTYTIAIKDNTGSKEGFPRIYFNNVGDKDKIVGINQWGTGKWTSMRSAFHGCFNLNDEGRAATDVPDLSGVTSMYFMFYGASSFNQDIGEWDTSTVTIMQSMFYGASVFNQDIGEWETGAVISMYAMFFNASTFNKNIEGWDTGTVETMNSMFYGASAFSNQDLSGWDVVEVTDHTNFMTGAGTNGANIEPIW